MTTTAPPDRTALDEALGSLVELMRGARSVVLAGAGCSTESGIPDYRGPEGRMRTRRPVQYGEFVRSPEVRQRYWARSAVGWRRVVNAQPNPTHEGFAQLEALGLVDGIITQNVDGLHQAAGSRRVIELHGSLADVMCLECDLREPRARLQERLNDVNPGWVDRIAGGTRAGRPEPAPDGDAELEVDVYAAFVVPGCLGCDGVLKPDVVFFGENVPRPRVDEAFRLLDAADVLLVAGSSLTVYSGRRFVYGAVEREIPIGVLNLGPTRADEVASAKVEGRLGEIVPRLAEALAIR